MVDTQPSDDLATFLQTNGHGTKGTDLFIGKVPDKLDDTLHDVIVLTDAGGIPHTTIADVDTVNIQILARNKQQNAARQVLLDIQADLHAAVQQDLGTFTIIAALALDRPAILRFDTKERWTLVSNYEIRMRLSS